MNRKSLILIFIFFICFLAPYTIFSFPSLAIAQPATSQSKTIKAHDVEALSMDCVKDKKQKERAESSQGLEILQIADPAWNAIREKKIDTVNPVALADLIDIAMRNNSKTRQSWHNIEVAQAQKKEQESALYPQANVNFDVIMEQRNGKTTSAQLNDLGYDPGLTLTYLLLDFGGRSASIEQTAHMLFSANAQYDQSIQDLFLAVQENYYNLYSAQSNAEASELNFETSKIDFDAAQKRFNAGVVAKLDVVQAQADYDNASYSLVIAKNNVVTAKASLAKTLGFAADTEIKIIPPSQELPIAPTDADATLLIDKAMQKRPDIASSREILIAKQAAIKAANSELFPKLNTEADLGYGNTTTSALSTAGGQKHYNYSIFLSAVWDMFDGFYNVNKKREAQAAADAEYESLVQDELQASVDVWTKYHNFNAAVSKFRYSKSLLASTSTSYDLSFQSYKAGLQSMLDLIQAKNDLTDARSKVIQSRQDVFVAFVDLTHATGSFDIKAEEKDMAHKR
ncbi:MAG: TolC family protein [Candidatus Omnitrophica bacterium]|nr:TolC family protein [Candidatus Omnitrophota bacterium]